LSYPEQWIASETVCGQTYSQYDSSQLKAEALVVAATNALAQACVVSGSTFTYTAAATDYTTPKDSDPGCIYEYVSDVSLAAAIALATTAAATLCAGQSVATSTPVTVTYHDPCGNAFSATAQATEPGGGSAAAGSAAYNAALAVATTEAEAEAAAQDPGCAGIPQATYAPPPVSGEVPVSSVEYRTANGQATATYTVCYSNGTTSSVTNTYTATYPTSGQGVAGRATVYSPNNATAIAAAQLLANTEAAAAAVALAEVNAYNAALAAAQNAEATAAAFCLPLQVITPPPTNSGAPGTNSGGSGSGSGSVTTPPVTDTGGSTTPGGSSGGVSTGGVASGSTLDAVACPSASTCMAVGYNQNGQGIWTVGTLSGLNWSWSNVASIPSDTTGVGYLLGVACPTTTTCIATGGSAGGSTGLGIESVGTLSGGTWAWTPEADVPGDANGGGVLFTIQCLSATQCVAGGDDGRWRGVATTVTLVAGTWEFARETMVASDANGGGRLLAMSCPSSSECVAVGDDDPGQATFTYGTLTNGTWTWAADKVILPDYTGVGTLHGVACPSTTLCIAVGYDNAQEGVESIGTLSSGVWTWTRQAQVYVGAVQMGDFTGITCSTVLLCTTVGYDGLSNGQAAGVLVSAGVPGFVDQLTITTPATGGGPLYAVASTGIGQYVSVGYSNIGVIVSTGS
jgi:hypothetical protein